MNDRLKFYVGAYGIGKGVELYTREQMMLQTHVAQRDAKNLINTERLNTISNSLWGS